MRLLLLLTVFFTISHADAARLSLIIDDIGYRQTDEAVLALPASVTLSILPHTPLGKRLAILAHNKGHEIMLHLPMQALNGKTMGPGGLSNQMDEQQLKQRVKDALKSVPFARGVNNHMGSLLTQLPEPMTWLMEGLKQHNSYFIDSMTTRYSRAGDIANHLGVPLLRRQVFLDNDISEQALETQFNRLIREAQQAGQLIAIAHPYPQTIHFLNKNLPRLTAQGISLVPPSSLLSYRLAHKGVGAADKRRLK